MPLVPTTVSRKIAAIVWAPSYLMTSSRPFSASAAGRGSFSPQRCVSGYRTTPTIPGSFAQRR